MKSVMSTENKDRVEVPREGTAGVAQESESAKGCKNLSAVKIRHRTMSVKRIFVFKYIDTLDKQRRFIGILRLY